MAYAGVQTSLGKQSAPAAVSSIATDAFNFSE